MKLNDREIERRLREALGIASNPLGIGTIGSTSTTLGELEVLSWLDWLEDADESLVRARLTGARWKMICWRFGISRATAYRRWRHALELITWRLNGNNLPTNCSRRRFMQIRARV